MSALSSKPLSTEPISGYITDNALDPITYPLGVPLKVWGVAIPYSGYAGQGLQVFTPTRISIFSAGQVLGTRADGTNNTVRAIRVKDATDYQINGQGATATMPANSVTGISHNVSFISFPNGGTVEIM